MNNNLLRINEFSMLKIVDSQQTAKFNIINNELSIGTNQYFCVDDNVENIVWYNGIYKHYLNKISTGNILYNPVLLNQQDKLYSTVHFKIQQGYVFDNIFGLHVIFIDTKTKEVLISKIVTIDDFEFTDDSVLIDGSFWLEECTFKIPQTNNIVMCQVTQLTYQDINPASGLLFDFPTDFVNLISEKPVPDYIKTLAVLDENNYLSITPTTDENKSFEQSLLDYFETSNAVINISHVITYGNDNAGWKSLRVGNENNKFGVINIGLNLLEYINQQIDIVISSEYLVDGKLMNRQTTLATIDTVINPFLTSLIIHPTTNYPVNVDKSNVINQTVIETKQVNNIVGIYQPVLVEFVNENIIFEPKIISFDKLISSTYLQLEVNTADNEQIQKSLVDKSGKYYFDLSLFKPITVNTRYTLIDVETQYIVGKGLVLLP